MLRYLLRSVLFSIVGFICYQVVFYFSFPTDEMRARLVSEAAKADFVLAVGDIKPSMFLGLDVDGLSVSKKKKAQKARSEDDGGPPPVPTYPFLNFDALDLELSPGPLLQFSKADRKVDVAFAGELYDGDMDGRLVLNQKAVDVDLQLLELDLARYPFINDDVQLDALGRADILTDIKWNNKSIKDTTGTVSLNIKNFALAKTSKIMGFELPVPLIFRESLMGFDIEDGKAELTTCSFSGDAITLEGEGNITLNKSFGRSRLNLKFRFKLGEELEAFSAFLPKKARSSDGWYHYALRGTLNNPSFREDTAAARKRGMSSTKSNKPAKKATPTPEPEDDMDEDEPVQIKRPKTTKSRVKNTRKKKPAGKAVSDEELARRRSDRRRLAEDRERRREERLDKIREQREQMRSQVIDDDGNGNLIPPFPGNENAPFRPPFGARSIPRPDTERDFDGRDDVDDEEYIMDDEDDMGPDDLGDPEVEIIDDMEIIDDRDDEGDFEEFIDD